MPGIKLIEGRAKEGVFWTVVVNNGPTLTDSACLVDTVSGSAGQRIIIKAMFYVVVSVAKVHACGGRLYLYRYSAACDYDQRRDHVAGIVYASASAIATGREY